MMARLIVVAAIQLPLLATAFTTVTRPSSSSAVGSIKEFVLPSMRRTPTATTTASSHPSIQCRLHQASSSSSDQQPQLTRIPPDMEGVAIPFVDVAGNSFIECYADSVAHVAGVEYTIGVPCDYSVALCFFDENEQLVPVELDDEELMDDIFPLAESIVAEEFGEELVLQRTPQTLTLVGELEDDDDDDDDEDDEGLGISGDSEDDEDDDEEEVEVLLSFEHRGKDFHLVRLLDPILLVGKVDPSAPDNRLLLTPQESDDIMPILEKAFLDFHDDDDNFDDDDLLP